jgi:two-component system, cell cycle response regulator
MPPANYRILLVDDDPAMLGLLTRWLERAGYSVLTAADGQQALEIIEVDCPDFLLTDWEMPHIDGLELCRRLRNMRLPHYVYTIFLTVRTAAADMIAGLQNGADDFLTKPVTEGELLARLQSSKRVLELERRLSVLAHTDFLTGLATKRTFFDNLEKEWHRSQRFRLPLSCVMVDLDFFKQINDVHGHPAGDAVLKLVAELLSDNSRASDTVARYGGEEYCIIMPESDEDDAAGWAERVRELLAALQVPIGDERLQITGSFGVAQCAEDCRDPEELVKQADQALLHAKRTSRNCVIRYSTLPRIHERASQPADYDDDVLLRTPARNAMTPLGACPNECDTVDEVVCFLASEHLSSVPVLDKDGTLAGFVSEKDVLSSMTSPGCWQQPISTVMRRNVVCYEEETPVRVIYDFLCRVTIRGVVITHNGHPTGTINRNSLLLWYREQFADQDAAALLLPHSLREGSTRGTASV